MALSPQWLDELKSRITLSALIGRTVKIQRAGREYKACCPFHNEKTPSFTINDQKGFYHCFGCGAHGGAIDWMIEQHGLPFMDAVKELAAEANMDVPAPDPAAAKKAEKRAGLHDVTATAQEWFVDNLRSADGAGARDYLAKRGFDDATIREFGFGYAPDSKQALQCALSRFDEEMLIEAGLRITVEDKAPYDRFRGRLMLPIQDNRERIIGFGGRILEARDGVAKYLNSPDTPLFDKGRSLYNIHRAAAASRQSERVIVAEGYMDVIALAAAGFRDAVAPMGTALTEQQIELLWRMADKPVLCFDGDAAGQRAAMRAVERALPLLRPGCSLQIVTMPAGMDPDDLIKRDGEAGMRKLLDSPASMLDVIWSHERDAQPLGSPEDKAGLKARLLEHVDAIQHPDIRSLYRRELMDRYGALAFPKREFNRPQFSGFKRDSNVIDFAQAKRAREGLRKIALDPERENKLHRRLGAALALGFVLHPTEVSIHLDELLRVPEHLLDRRLAALIDVMNLDELSDPEDAAAIIRNDGKTVPSFHEFDNLHFTFVLDRSEPDQAKKSLKMGVRLYAGWPALLLARDEIAEQIKGGNHSEEEAKRLFERQQEVRVAMKNFPNEIKQLLSVA